MACMWSEKQKIEMKPDGLPTKVLAHPVTGETSVPSKQLAPSKG